MDICETTASSPLDRRQGKTSATFREILDAMWLFNSKFERALSKFDEIKARQKVEVTDNLTLWKSFGYPVQV